MQLPIRFEVDVPSDHVIKLPEDVPVGHVQVIVLPVSPTEAVDRLALARSLLATSPSQHTDSVDLVREDRDR